MRVLVTGAARFLGAHLSARLSADSRVSAVVGVDAMDPPDELAAVLGSVEFHRVDPRTPEVTRLLVDAEIDTVAHLALSASANLSAGGGRAAMKELNVIGTMQLLAACQRTPTLERFVLRSSTAAYGASFRDPAVFTEDTEPRELPRGGFARDVVDVEGYVRGFQRRRPDVLATVLRFAPLIGPNVGTRLGRYFARPVVPTVLGRDPRLQFTHVDDAFEVLGRAVTEAHPGTFNVAGSGVLTLSQAIRRAGRVPAPVAERCLATVVAAGGGTRRIPFTLDELGLFVHGRVVDTTRLEREFGFLPRPTAVAFDDFLRACEAMAPLKARTVEAAERFIARGIRDARRKVASGE